MPFEDVYLGRVPTHAGSLHPAVVHLYVNCWNPIALFEREDSRSNECETGIG